MKHRTQNDLILTMGHPVNERMYRLSQTVKQPFLGIPVSLAVSALVLVTTSFSEAIAYPKNTVAPIISSIIDGQEYTIQGQAFSLTYANVRRGKSTAFAGASDLGIYRSALSRKDGIIGYDPSAENGWKRFPPMHHSDRCVRYIAQKNTLPYWYKEVGKVVLKDQDTDIYRMACLPGTNMQIKAMTTDDFIQGLNASPELSAVEREQLASFYRKGGPKIAAVSLENDGR